MYPSRKAAGHLAARACAAVGIASTLLLGGCHNFFLCEKASCPSGGGSTGNYAYISNASAGSTDISAYDIGNGSLAAISGFPFNLNYVPVAMAVSPNDAFLYVASSPGATNPGIYVYSINSSTGQLSGPSGGGVQVSGAISSMDISPDGGFLFVINTAGNTLSEYQVNSSTGALAPVSSVGLPGTDCTIAATTPVTQTCTVKVAPSKQFVLASVGTGGTAIFPYTSSSGITTTSPSQVIPSGSTQSAPSGDFSVVLDNNNFAYIARTSTLAVYSITSTGGYNLAGMQPYSGTEAPRDVVLSSTQAWVYTANPGASDISGFTIATSGTLTTIAGSPFSGPASVSAIGADKSGKYMVAVGYNGTSGVQLFTVGTNGALTLVTSAGTGTSTDFPALLALTH